MYKLLIVDDDPGIREGLAMGLSDDFEVGQVSSGQAALARVEHERPDVVLLDQNMEGLSGTGVLAGMGRQSWRPAVVMFSATMDVSLVRRALKLGANDCLSKPFSLEALKGRLEAAAKGGASAGSKLKPFGARVAELMTDDSAPVNGQSLETSRRQFARSLFAEALLECEGDLDLAAAKLGIDREALLKAIQSVK